ncbi:galactokinase [Algoriphagus machipongonensis]|uniref:Galactokinase n=1 Tax=Algoriphagus machipongonensis TaxID=388413 RepID=A3HYY0_9BACT|nr:galactokinase [Algoriphagus machipongonensis]EAZ80466.1 galactokinase [Algoriphagus machipongonensis]
MREKIAKSFLELFKKEPLISFAPGRINLIGEHTDYQEGFVFPAAVSQGIWVGICKNETTVSKIHSLDFEEDFAFDINDFSPKKGHWANYIMGMVSLLKQAGYPVKGFDIVFGGDIPVGSGLSSSAALSVAIGTAISAVFDFKISKKSIAIYAQKSEHLFEGLNCGIMDPYASAFGKENHALLLDCRSNSHEEIPLELGGYSLLLTNTNVKHKLADSAYNKRREACEKSVEILQNSFPGITTLRDLTPDDLAKVKELLPVELFPKAKHVIMEDHRVKEAGDCLKNSDLIAFGKLMWESHESLSKDYEVSCPELDFLVKSSKQKPYVLGSRMMGGGFGGCTISLLETSKKQELKDYLSTHYKNQFNIDPEFIEVTPSEGARILG